MGGGRHEVGRSSPSGVEVKNEWNSASTLPACLRDVDRCYFTFNSIKRFGSRIRRLVIPSISSVLLCTRLIVSVAIPVRTPSVLTLAFHIDTGFSY